MFTGIIRHLGSVQKIEKGRDGAMLTVRVPKSLGRPRIGDSIAVNGACLTVTKFSAGMMFMNVMPETISLTTLGLLKTGDTVNLESSLRLNDRLDGHLMYGHVDGVGKISKIAKDHDAIRFTITFPKSLSPYIVKKGAVAVDGISLTITKVQQNSFEVSVLSFTLKETNLQFRKTRSVVNLEVDPLARYARLWWETQKKLKK